MMPHFRSVIYEVPSHTEGREVDMKVAHGFGTEPEPRSQHPVYEYNIEHYNQSIFIAVP